MKVRHFLYKLIILSFWLGAVNAFDIPVRQAFVIEMVDHSDDLNNAIALNSSIVNVGRLLGPALGGVLTALFGVGSRYLKRWAIEVMIKKQKQHLGLGDYRVWRYRAIVSACCGKPN